jgi:dinuclear metal center protein, YbgI/SA1388 family
MISVHRLIETLDDWMQPANFLDYAPNGLQVEGRSQVQRLALGVTASQAVIDAAIEWGADALLVHHGYFWKNESPCLTGMKGARVKALMAADLNLIGYHLPLDCHPEFGNNVRLLHHFGWTHCEPVAGTEGLLWRATLNTAHSPEAVAQHVSDRLDRQSLLIESAKGPKSVQHIIVCTGGAQDSIHQAAAHGADLYLSGEISERTTHEAREMVVHYIAAGYHATERHGVQALGSKIAKASELESQFLDDGNPA